MHELVSFFTTENQLFCNILTFFFAFFEMSLLLYFLHSLYNINFSKKLFALCVFSITILVTFCKLILPMPFNFIFNFLFIIPALLFLLKLSPFKATLGVSIFISLSIFVEYIINLIITRLFNYDNLYASTFIPIYKIGFSLLLYFSIFLIILFFRHFYSNSSFAESSNKKDNFKLITVILLTLLIILPNYIFLTLLNMNLPTTYVIYNIISGFVFFLVGIYSTNRINKLQITQRELETANLYNTTLSKLVDSNKAFRHDMTNYFNAIAGYIELNDINGLKNYFSSGLLPEIQKAKNLSLLNPDIINSPPVFGLLLAKYNIADNLGVKIELNSFFDYSTIKMNVFDFVKILGILLDNAIEAACKCDEKLVSIYVTIDFYNRKQSFTISNSFLDTNIDINKIFDKDFSTKEIKSGFGLWEVKQLLKKYNNVKLITSKDSNLFSQKLEIYF